jgi:hypothetical protein
LFCVGLTANAQEEKQRDSVTVRDFIPRGIRVGADVVSLIRSRYDDSFTGWEMNAELEVHRYFLAFEMGNWQLDLTSDDSDYANRGTYFRIGADVNFTPRNPQGNILFLGARYGRSIFSESLTTMVMDPVWGDQEVQYNTDDASGRWFEVTGGLRVRLWKVVWLGYTARFKFGLGTKGTGEMEPHDVPGYGTNDKDSTWGFSYLVMIRIPLRK